MIAAGVLFLFGCNTEKKDSTEQNNNNQSMTENYPAFEISGMDNTIKPGNDFYEYVNGSWLKNNPIPEEYSSYGNAQILMEKNYEALKSILETAAADTTAPAESNSRKIGDFYASGMDTTAIEESGLKSLKGGFEKINSISNIAELQKVLAEMHTYSISALFSFHVMQDMMDNESVIINLYQGGLSLPDRDYYLNDDDRSKELREAFKAHIKNMLAISGSDSFNPESFAADVMEVETNLATFSLSRTALRNPYNSYHKTAFAELEKQYPTISWTQYLSDLGTSTPDSLNLAQPEFFKGIDDMLSKIDLNKLKNYLSWKTMSASAPYLGKQFEKENFNFYSTTLNGVKEMKPRWKRVLNVVNGSLGEAVGERYVAQYFPPAAKEKMLGLVANLKKALNYRIQNLDWMTDETRKQALEKLEGMNVKIGYPDKWEDYSSLEISRDSYLKNVFHARKFSFQKDLAKIGQPVDRDEWFMSPQTINAYYHPLLNEIVFPAAILQPPFFNLNADDAVNYGAIGAVIGHEMTHGFDDQGRQYDKEGTLRDWWTAADAEAFTARVQPLVQQYNSYEVLDSVFIDGELTLGENIADLGGLTVAYNAYISSLEGKEKPEAIDGFTDKQRFFLSFGQVWRQNIVKEDLMNRIKTDVHSPTRYRVNGVVYNMPEFYEAFEIAETDALYRAPENRPKVW